MTTQNYRVIRVKEEVYIKVKEAQLELLRQGYGKAPSMSDTLSFLITRVNPNGKQKPR